VSGVDAVALGASTFRPEGGDSSRERLGVMLRKNFGGDEAEWTPYVSVNAVHESDGKSAYSIDNTFFGASSTGGTSALIEGGLSVQIGHLSIFGSANWQDGGALEGFSGGQLGLRYNW
jgi:outer membrane autotransporter protein